MNIDELINPFCDVQFHEDGDGYIVWRTGTGGNAELLHIRTPNLARGAGRRLMMTMVRRLRNKPPYATVFGFTRLDNKAAHKFYRSLGFTLSLVWGVYADGCAVVFSINWPDLERNLFPDDKD